MEGKRRWLHTARTEPLSEYRVHAKQGREAMDEMGLLPEYAGVAVHGGLNSYFGYPHCTHALCNAHYLRELRFIHEQYGRQWVARLRVCLRLAHRLKQGRGPSLTDKLKALIEQNGTIRSWPTVRPSCRPIPHGHRDIGDDADSIRRATCTSAGAATKPRRYGFYTRSRCPLTTMAPSVTCA